MKLNPNNPYMTIPKVEWTQEMKDNYETFKNKLKMTQGIETCWICDGMGKVNRLDGAFTECNFCGGTGAVPKMKVIRSEPVADQSKRMSFIESVTNTFVGFITTLIVSPGIYYLCDIKMSFPQMGLATFLFTVVSIIRNYFIRRFFTKKT